jgi:hypothetical protein
MEVISRYELAGGDGKHMAGPSGLGNLPQVLASHFDSPNRTF